MRFFLLGLRGFRTDYFVILRALPCFLFVFGSVFGAYSGPQFGPVEVKHFQRLPLLLVLAFDVGNNGLLVSHSLDEVLLLFGGEWGAVNLGLKFAEFQIAAVLARNQRVLKASFGDNLLPRIGLNIFEGKHPDSLPAVALQAAFDF